MSLNFACFFLFFVFLCDDVSPADIFYSKLIFSKNNHWNTIRESYILDPWRPDIFLGLLGTQTVSEYDPEILQ